MKHLLFMTPSPIENAYNREQQDGWLAAVAEVSKALDGIIVCPWACDEDLNAWDRPYMVKLVGAIRTHGLELINGRDLFPRKDDELLGFLAPGDPTFYTRALATLEAERKRLGCAMSWLSSEPYDKGRDDRRFFSDKQNGWKRTGFTPADLRRVRHAIAGVSSYVPQATVIEPGWTSNRPKGREQYGHAFRDLGKIAAIRDTYRLSDPAALEVPDPDAVECLGFWLTTDPTQEKFAKYGDRPPLSVEQHLAIDWAAVQEHFTNLHTIYIYTEAEEKRAVMLKLGELAA